MSGHWKFQANGPRREAYLYTRYALHRVLLFSYFFVIWQAVSTRRINRTPFSTAPLPLRVYLRCVPLLCLHLGRCRKPFSSLGIKVAQGCPHRRVWWRRADESSTEKKERRPSRCFNCSGHATPPTQRSLHSDRETIINAIWGDFLALLLSACTESVCVLRARLCTARDFYDTAAQIKSAGRRLLITHPKQGQKSNFCFLLLCWSHQHTQYFSTFSVKHDFLNFPKSPPVIKWLITGRLLTSFFEFHISCLLFYT